MTKTMTSKEARKAYKRALAREIKAGARHDAKPSARSLAAFAAASDATNAAIRALNAAITAEENAIGAPTSTFFDPNRGAPWA